MHEWGVKIHINTCKVHENLRHAELRYSMGMWLHAHALNVRVDLEGPVAALNGMKSEAVSSGR
jgi:hypothetical protein